MTRTITDRLRRAGAAAALLLSAVAASAAVDPIPQAPIGRPVEYESTQALFGRAGIFEPEAQTTERWEYGGQRLARELTVGSYARIEKHLKVGAFYRLQYGARHDDDWTNDPAGHWIWRHTLERPESVFVLDATPRVALSFLPGGDWVASVKLRAEHDFFDRQNTALVSPELAWFWMDGLTPVATVSLREETWLPLNWGETRVSSYWWYLAALWHAQPWLSVGPLVALRDETWSTSSDYRSQNPGADYKVRYRSWILGGNLVVHLR